MSVRLIAALSLSIGMLLLHGCTGAGALPAPNTWELAAQPRPDDAKTTPVVIVIQWKSALNAQSVRVDIAPAGSPSDSAVTKIVERPAHASTSSVGVALKPGNTRFTFTVFAKRLAGGNELGGGAVIRTIRSGDPATIRAVFAGYAAAFEIDPQDARLQGKSGSASQTLPMYDVVGQAPLTFGVSVQDANGDVILGSAAPLVKAFSDAPATFAVSRVRSLKNTFTIQAVGPMPTGSASPHLVLEAPGADATQVVASYPLVETSLMYASAGTGATAHIYAFDTLGNAYRTPGKFQGLTRPIGLAHDVAHARLYVADAGSSKVLAFDENGNAVAGFTPPSVPGINGITFSSHTDHIYVTSDQGSGGVEVFNAEGAPVSLPHGFATLHATPVSIAYDPGTKLIAVVESGSPGFLDMFTDTGSYNANLSQALIDLNGFPFTPINVAASYANGGFWISGEDNSGSSSPIPMVALYTISDVSGGLAFLAGECPGCGGQVSSFYNNITAPVAAQADPDNPLVFYVLEESGPIYGFSCTAQGCWDSFPSAISPGGPSGGPQGVSVPGYIGTIDYSGVPYFTALVFDQY
jgi:hypothetical protein